MGNMYYNNKIHLDYTRFHYSGFHYSGFHYSEVPELRALSIQPGLPCTISTLTLQLSFVDHDNSGTNGVW